MKKIIIIVVILGLFLMANMAFANSDSGKNSFEAVWKAINDLRSQMNATQASCTNDAKPAAPVTPATPAVSKPKKEPVISPQEDKTVYKSENYKIKNLTIN